MKSTLGVALTCLAAGLFAPPAQAQAPAPALSADAAVTAMVQEASRRIERAAAELGYAKHALYLRAIAVESDASRAVGTMSRIGVARVDARSVRTARLTRDDVAWVIAHEFAHFILRHPERRALVHSYEDGRNRSTAHQALELEADRLGLQLATAAGYAFEPRAFFLRLRGGRLAGESATHPADADRIRALRDAH